MQRKTVTTQLTIRHLKLALDYGSSGMGDKPIPTLMGVIPSNTKGSSLKTKGSKVKSCQGSKRQVSKDVARGIIARECPLESYVSAYINWNFGGFLSGSEPTLSWIT